MLEQAQCFQLMQQLIDIALQHLMHEDTCLPVWPSATSRDTPLYAAAAPRTTPTSSRSLHALAKSQRYRRLFSLPARECLDGECPASLWTPYDKRNVTGTMYLSANYMCFSAKVGGAYKVGSGA